MKKTLFLLFTLSACLSPVLASAKPPNDAGVDAGSPPAGTTYTFCSNMQSTCNVVGTKWVRFGNATLDQWSPAHLVTNSVFCSVTVFGDPSPGNWKTCEVQTDAPVDAGTADAGVADAGTPADGGVYNQDAGGTVWTYCSFMEGTCTVAVPSMVRFGFVAADQWSTPVLVTDSIFCSVTTFGDPSPGNSKICESTPVP